MRLFFAVALALALLASATPESLASPYTIIDLGQVDALGGHLSVASAISGRIVTGWYLQEPEGNARAFTWDGMTLHDLGTLGGRESAGLAVNGPYVVGSAADVDQRPRAFLWDGHQMIDLGVGGAASVATAVSEDGKLATGFFDVDDHSPASHAFLWNGSEVLDLGTLGGNSSAGLAISGSNVTGWSHLPGDATSSHAFLSVNGAPMTGLGTLGGPRSVGVAISGTDVTGWSDAYVSERLVQRAFLSRNGEQMQDLGTLGGLESSGIAVSRGWVTGWASTEPGSRHAFLWNGEAMIDLHPRLYGVEFDGDSEGLAIAGGIVAGRYNKGPFDTSWRAFVSLDGGEWTDLHPEGWLESWAVWVDEHGNASGWGYHSDGHLHAFYATRGVAVPEPASSTLGLLGSGALLVRGWRRARGG